jgi:hypothetical protein
VVVRSVQKVFSSRLLEFLRKRSLFLEKKKVEAVKIRDAKKKECVVRRERTSKRKRGRTFLALPMAAERDKRARFNIAASCEMGRREGRGGRGKVRNERRKKKKEGKRSRPSASIYLTANGRCAVPVPLSLLLSL